ncbi:specificity protein phosphatase 26 [Seminavis robusta]|uniref:Specificity protein phosphatase 26 n=1 Tax=Seminavis robusta TaxID=568900 RepID=A0A9N8F405_9STRA|nr:specificity protein phosphatase 26 [Seminavis robusta]|eukprot:Sro2843_g338310.1 specificity protein phosphatase 26 (241) ;mRNA; r:4012-4734
MNTNAKQQYTYRSEDWPWVWAIRNPEILDCNRALQQDEIRTLALMQNQIRYVPLPVSDNLLIGCRHSVLNSEVLKEMGITHVLNMAGPHCKLPVEDFVKTGIVYKELDAQDDEEYPLLELHWQEARVFINGAREKNGKCVVNCGGGMNRSGLIVAAAMLCEEDKKRTVLEVVRDLRKVRGNWALANEFFQEQLVALARSHGRLGPAPGEDGSFVDESPPAEVMRVSEAEQPDGLLLLTNY